MTDITDIHNSPESSEVCDEMGEQTAEVTDTPADNSEKEEGENGHANSEETTPSDEKEQNGTDKAITRKVRKVWKQHSETRKKIKEMQNTKNKNDGKADEVVDPEDNYSIKERKMNMRLPLAICFIILLFAAIGVTIYLLYEHKPELFNMEASKQEGMTTGDVATTTTTTEKTTTTVPPMDNMMNKSLRMRIA